MRLVLAVLRSRSAGLLLPRKAKLLRIVLSTCAIDAANVYPIYRKPFDLIFQRARNEEWRALEDDFRTLIVPNARHCQSYEPGFEGVIDKSVAPKNAPLGSKSKVSVAVASYGGHG